MTAYEGLVGAAAGYVAVDGRATADTSSVSRLTEATDLLRGIADGLAEMTTGGSAQAPGFSRGVSASKTVVC